MSKYLKEMKSQALIIHRKLQLEKRANDARDFRRKRTLKGMDMKKAQALFTAHTWAIMNDKIVPIFEEIYATSNKSWRRDLWRQAVFLSRRNNVKLTIWDLRSYIKAWKKCDKTEKASGDR